jgi:hypothetical protein
MQVERGRVNGLVRMTVGREISELVPGILKGVDSGQILALIYLQADYLPVLCGISR